MTPLEPPIKRKSRIKVLKILVLIIVLLFGSFWVVNEITPVPFSMLFKTMMANKNDVVNLGPYEQNVSSIVTEESVNVNVTGYPDASFTIYRQPSSQPQPVIFFIHGGGWIVGSSWQLASFSQLMASYGYTVISLDYSLAPENTYPTPIIQSLATLSYLEENQASLGINMNNYIISGNSAGAQIASQLGSLITTPSDVFPTSLNPSALKGLALINGVYNFDTVQSSRFPGFDKFAWSYTGKKNYTEYERIRELSSFHHINENYPASFITVGDADPLESQTYAFDAKLRANNVDVTSVYWTGTNEKLFHDYIFDLSTEPAQSAFETMMEFIYSKTH